MVYRGELDNFYVIVLVESCSKGIDIDGEKGRREYIPSVKFLVGLVSGTEVPPTSDSDPDSDSETLLCEVHHISDQNILARRDEHLCQHDSQESTEIRMM